MCCSIVIIVHCLASQILCLIGEVVISFEGGWTCEG